MKLVPEQIYKVIKKNFNSEPKTNNSYRITSNLVFFNSRHAFEKRPTHIK